MASLARTTTSRAPMSTMRKTALVAGVLYLATFISSIPAALLLGSTLTDPAYILGAGADGQVRLAAIFDIINGLTAIGTAVALYAVVRRQHEGFAIGFVAARVLEAAILFIGTVAVLSIADLRVTGAAADPASLKTIGLSLPRSTTGPSPSGPASRPSTAPSSDGCCIDPGSSRAPSPPWGSSAP